MKRALTIALIALTTTSCEKGFFSPQQTDATKKFTFTMKGDFATSFEAMTKGYLSTDSGGVTDLWVLDYVDGTLKQQVHQSPADEDFGKPTMNLTYGQHEIKFIAGKGDTPSLTSSSLSWAKVKDTFVLDYPVEVKTSSNGNRAPELKRAVTAIKIVMADAIPSAAKTISVTMNRSQSLALPSLEATEAVSSTVTNEIPSSWLGTKNNSFMVYTLCPEDEMTTDVHVRVASATGTLSDFTIADVSLKKNRVTSLTGSIFGASAPFSIAIDDEWETSHDINF